MIEASYVSPDKVSVLWEDLTPLFERVLEHNHDEMSLEDIKLYLDTGQMQLFVVNTGRDCRSGHNRGSGLPKTFLT